MIARFIIHHLWLIDLLCLLVIPLLILCFGWFFSRRRHTKRPLVIGLTLALIAAATFCYGRFFETQQLEVRHVELTFSDLPAEFDGYRLVQVSDLHVGSLPDGMLQRVVDSINAQQPGLILFTGDMINCAQAEMERVLPQLKRMKAKDGICSVLGNHDYGYYELADDANASIQEGSLVSTEMDMKWRVLLNGYRYVRRGDKRLVIAGMENDSEEPSPYHPQKGNLNIALDGVSLNDFVIMLEHDPTSWRRTILRHCHAQLTLSGHTHGGQITLFGWAPASLRYRECEGLYTIKGRHLYVSKGVGGAIPFRLGAKPEIVVITLRRGNSQS